MRTSKNNKTNLVIRKELELASNNMGLCLKQRVKRVYQQASNLSLNVIVIAAFLVLTGTSVQAQNPILDGEPSIVLNEKSSINNIDKLQTVSNIEAVKIKKENTLPKPKVIIFDVNETLLDLSPLKKSVGKALYGRDDLLPLWFSTMLHYSLVETLSDNYHHFGEIGTAALMMVAKNQGIDIEYKDAKKSIVTPLRSLQAYPDVAPGLKALNQDNFHIVSLTNSSAEGVETQFRNADLIQLFKKRYTIESIKKYKPHPDTYKMVLKDLGVKPEEVLMVAAHAWDLAGAKNVGLQTAFIARPGKALYPNIAKPDYVVKNLTELVKTLQQQYTTDNEQ